MRFNRRKRRLISLADFLNQMGVPTKDLYAIKYKKSLEDARASLLDQKTIESLNIRTGYYSMRTRLKNNPWVREHPASKAYSWLFKTVFKHPEIYRYNRRLMYSGGMFTFNYRNPKYAGTSVLPWFDKFPLVISLGPHETNLGLRNLGFNMHLLPPKIRLIIMCSIFELHKRMYRFQVFMKQNKPVNVDYRLIIKNLERYGIKFCIRMYIPNRQTQIVCFPIKEWHKAIFIPSRGYDGIRARQLIKEWKDYNRKNGIHISENLDWKSNI